MRIAIFSDIHANLAAFQACIEAADDIGAEWYVCLGDIVGYGPSPEACLSLARSTFGLIVQGNHDLAVSNGEGIEALPKDGQAAARLHQARLSTEQRDALASLPLTASVFDCTFVHATPDAPDRWRRLESHTAARGQFEHFDTTFCFMGHTHIPGLLADRLGVFKVKPGRRYLINVGSVGQPRDGDPRAAFGLLDTDAGTYTLHRVAYDVEKTVALIRDAGLPDQLAQRLRRGR